MIPQAMKEANRWIIWKPVPNKRTGKIDKRPLDPRTKKPFERGSQWQTDSANWVSYDEAVATGEQLGFLLGDGWAGLDFDDVIVNGVPADWVQRILREFDTYAEISPSLTGIKVFMRASLVADKMVAKRAGIEVYDRQRFFTVTGRGLTPVGIGQCDEALQKLFDTLKQGDVLDLCRLRGLLLSTGKPGFIDVRCPWASEHSGGGNHTSTSFHVTEPPSIKADGFKCLHAHCAERTLGDVRAWLNLPKLETSVFPDCDSKGNPIADSQGNIRGALQQLGVSLAFDEFVRRPLIRWPDNERYQGALDDRARNRLWLMIDEQFRFRPSAAFFDTVLQDLARQHPFHPVRDYLNALTWDGQPRIDRWLVEYAGATDDLYTQAVGSLFLRAAVNRVFTPGCKFDEMLVLVSPKQGTFKSSLLRTLCPGGAWFSDDLPLGVDAKEVIERTSGIWIVEVSDLHGYGTRELNQVKAMMSRQADGPVRLAYERFASDQVPRHFVIGGTSNTVHFLKDKTGNRRFWPVPVVNTIALDALARDRDQLWAEAVARRAESIRLDPSLYGEAGKRQAQHQRDDPWYVALEQALGLCDGAVPMDRLRLTEPWGLLNIPTERRSEKDAERIDDIMIALGYEKKQARGLTKSDAASVKRWCHRDDDIAKRARATFPAVAQQVLP